MRLFQNSVLYPSYLTRLNRLARGTNGFDERRRVFLEDRFGALHFLLPVLTGATDAFFTNGDDEILQRLWSREQGMSGRPSLASILLAQIEHHRTEVFYNLDPVRYPSEFVRKLPGCVRKTLCWRAAPSGNADLTAYDGVLGNFPSILEHWRSKGCTATLFFPAIDPVMNEYGHGERPIDVLFVGGYSRHHLERAKMLDEVARLWPDYKIEFHLDTSRLTLLAESKLGQLLPLRKYRRPGAVAKISEPPVFGRRLYELLGKSKIVLNGAIDMAGKDRGNMRCFEAIGCGAALVSDEGNYPSAMSSGSAMLLYSTPKEAVELIQKGLGDWHELAQMADKSRGKLCETYSKDRQWHDFVEIADKY